MDKLTKKCTVIDAADKFKTELIEVFISPWTSFVHKYIGRERIAVADIGGFNIIKLQF